MALSRADRTVLTVGIFLAILIGIGLLYFYLAVAKTQFVANKATRENLKTEAEKLARQYKEMVALVNQRDKVQKDLAIIEEAVKRLPLSPEPFDFLLELADLLELSGVKYSKITPKPLSVKANYTEIPYEINCLARYHEFGQFLNMLEQNPRRFMRIKHFIVNNDKKRPSLHPIAVGIATFMLNI